MYCSWSDQSNYFQLFWNVSSINNVCFFLFMKYCVISHNTRDNMKNALNYNESSVKVIVSLYFVSLQWFCIGVEVNILCFAYVLEIKRSALCWYVEWILKGDHTALIRTHTDSHLNVYEFSWKSHHITWSNLLEQHDIDWKPTSLRISFSIIALCIPMVFTSNVYTASSHQQNEYYLP